MMGWEQRNADFCKAQTDAQMAYIEAEREVDQLQDENAKLVMKLNAEHLVRQNVERENAKLRELVRVFYHCTTSGECDECPINGGGPVHLMPDAICDTIHDRMRELGVEV